MANIRPLEQADLPALDGLIRANLPDWAPRKDIPTFLTATLLDDPWSDDELPSLVATGDDGEVIGFIGSQVRRFQFGDRALRGVCPSHLVVAPDRRGGAAGALLLRRLLTAGQDFTFSDSASAEVTRIWQTFHGDIDHARVCDWMVVLRPIGWLGGISAAAIRRRRVGREEVPVGAFPFQAAGRWIVRRAFPEPDPEISGEDADAATIVEHLPEMTAGFKLRAAYDRQYLDHLFAQVESRFGSLVRRIVRRAGRPVGWYVRVPQGSRVSRVLHLAATAKEGDAVLGELVLDAKRQGSAVIAGRLEPHLIEPLRHRLAVLGFARQPVIHSHDAGLRASLATSKSLLTQLDSEWFVN